MSEDANVAAVNTAKRTRVPLFSAFFMIYIFVSGGSFGIEEMVASSGPGLTLLLLLVLPIICLLYTSPSPRDATLSRMPSSA